MQKVLLFCKLLILSIQMNLNSKICKKNENNILLQLCFFFQVQAKKSCYFDIFQTSSHYAIIDLIFKILS